MKTKPYQIKQLFVVLMALSGCMTNYPITTFYVKNNSGKTLNFKASVLKYNSMGQFEMTLSFAVPPNDSIIARRVGFKENAEPTAWFTQFIIFPADGISFNSPNDPVNWVKTIDKKGKPVYTFTMTKK